MLNRVWSELRYRFRAVVQRADVERELRDELAFHLDREAEKHRRGGASADDAMRRAAIGFGGVDRITEDTRDARGVMLLQHFMQDLSYAVRGLRAHPLFACGVIATLALGVGVNTAMFGILDRTLFRAPAGMIDPGSVHRVYVASSGSNGKRNIEMGLEYPRIADLARWSRTIDASASLAYRGMAVGDGHDTRQLVVGVVSASYFRFFRMAPTLGRFFDTTEDQPPAGTAVAVISHDYWQSQFGGRTSAIGARLLVGQRTYTIIGVAPAGFDGVSEQRHPSVFVPVTAHASTVDSSFYRTYHWSGLEMLVRSKRGVSASALEADLSAALARSWNAQRSIEPGQTSADVARPEVITGPVQVARGPLAGPESRVAMLMGSVALIVLLVACANVANLLLARTLRRRRELAVRRAMGGTRARLMQQLLTETLVLATFGTAAGLVAAELTAGALRRTVTRFTDDWSVLTDIRTLAFALGVTVCATLLAGLIPAFHAGRDDLAGSLKAGAREGTYHHSRIRVVLLLLQTTLSTILLVGAGLFVRSLRQVRAVPLGYDVTPVAYVEASSRGAHATARQVLDLEQRLVAEASAIPGVERATPVVSVPFWSTERAPIFVTGIDSENKLGRFLIQAASPEYFATVGTRIVRGRGLASTDRAGAQPVAVISEAMATTLWHNDNPIGKCFRIGSDTMPCTTIVGVAENIRARVASLGGGADLIYYLPIEQYAATNGPPPMLALFARVHGRADDYVERLRARLQPLMPAPIYLTVRPLHEIVDPTMQSWVSGAKMFMLFGVLALSLAGVGLYAVIAFAVVQRTQEIGVRIALGARGIDVLALIVGDGIRVTLGGLVIGALVALATSRAVAPLLFHVSPRDPLVYGIVAATLLVVGVAASLIPAFRASRVDANSALRAE